MKGVFKGHRCWGLPQWLLATISCIRGVQGEYKECTLESSAKTLRSPEVKGELSRFKLRRKYRRSHCIYICGDPAHGPSSVCGRKAKMDIKGRVVCAIKRRGLCN